MNNRPQKAGGAPFPGPGALCAEAQADGVPCSELGRECEECERAVRSVEGEAPAEGMRAGASEPPPVDW